MDACNTERYSTAVANAIALKYSFKSDAEGEDMSNENG